MPKLSQQTLAENKLHIEAAAQSLFIRRGYHATTMREIAARADVSLGNLYNYYRTKEGLLESIIARYQEIVGIELRAMFDDLDEPFHPGELIEFGRQVRALVHEHADYWRLMYIDVMEFENRHFRKMFDNLAKKMRRQFAGYFAQLREDGSLSDGVDPAIGFTAAYMQFFNYFLVEKLFGGNRHFGLSDERVLAELSGLFCRGVLRPEKLAQLQQQNGKPDGSRARDGKIRRAKNSRAD